MQRETSRVHQCVLSESKIFLPINFNDYNVLPENMCARSSADEQKVRQFTLSIDKRGGSANLEQILVETSDFGGDEIRAVETLVQSKSTDFSSIREVLNHALSDENRRYQSTIRVLTDNGWISTVRSERGLEFTLTKKAYDELEWI